MRREGTENRTRETIRVKKEEKNARKIYCVWLVIPAIILSPNIYGLTQSLSKTPQTELEVKPKPREVTLFARCDVHLVAHRGLTLHAIQLCTVNTQNNWLNYIYSFSLCHFTICIGRFVMLPLCWRGKNIFPFEKWNCVRTQTNI